MAYLPKSQWCNLQNLEVRNYSLQRIWLLVAFSNSLPCPMSGEFVSEAHCTKQSEARLRPGQHTRLGSSTTRQVTWLAAPQAERTLRELVKGYAFVGYKPRGLTDYQQSKLCIDQIS